MKYALWKHIKAPENRQQKALARMGPLGCAIPAPAQCSSRPASLL